MRVVGLIGGMSWESTTAYYRILNETVRDRLGGQHSARILLYSVDFAPLERMQAEDRWEEAAGVLVDAALRLERGGAELLLLCTNTMHKVADAIAASVEIPLLHIADATADAIAQRGITCVGLLGTRYTMELNFYRAHLERRHELEVLIPYEAGRQMVHDVIYDELCRGEVRAESRRAVVQVIERLQERGAQGVVLGCTELGLLVGPEDSPLPLFDTTRLHALAAVEAALS
jgi:aspartate racemase